MSNHPAFAGMPMSARNRVTEVLETIDMVAQIKNPAVAVSMTPSALRGLVRKDGKRKPHAQMPAKHSTHFDLRYELGFPEMLELYRRAVDNQWDGDRDLPWDTDVDPLHPDTPLIAPEWQLYGGLEQFGIKLNQREAAELAYSQATWMLSNFMHGEQGALYASAQVTESVRWLDGKLYGATQVMDEARHLEVFHRYLDTKLNKIYKVNDNLFVIIDDLLTDSRWDIKFLGMQIMVEGLALGAFATLHNWTREPLLRQLLKYVIQDEARHVHYGVLALRDHITMQLSPAERREREDWAFEVAVLMRNRFMAHEVYEEWFEGTITRKQWNDFMLNVESMRYFRHTMFKRLVPNLEYIGLLSDRMRAHYEQAGMLEFVGGKNATQLSGEEMVAELE